MLPFVTLPTDLKRLAADKNVTLTPKGSSPTDSTGGPEAELIPEGRLSGPMPWVIAIMVALTVVAAAAGLALSNTVASASDELAGGITVQVVEANPAERERRREANAGP